MSLEDSTQGKLLDLRARSGKGRVGLGKQVRQLPPNVPRRFESFRGGLVLSDDPENVPENASPNALDLNVDEADALVRFPGIESIETFAGGHNPRELFTHADLDGNTELVMFDSPYMGYRSGTSATTWVDAALPTGNAWAVANHGGQLVLSNGNIDVYYRDPLGAVVTALGWDPAISLASFAGRVYALGGSIGGVPNPLGIKWTGASGLVTDIGTGSGAELLLADVAEGDRGMALKVMGFGLMLILLRKSLWVATLTGDPFRPATFEPRANVGTVSQATVKVVQNGAVMFLSDSGVELYDGNSVTHMSTAIDAELLPLDFTQISKYGAVYSALTHEYRLFTPSCTWVYSFKYSRWLKSSAKPSRAVSLFNPSIVDIGTTPGGWGLYWGGSWGGSVALDNVTLADVVYLQGAQLGVDDPTITTFFGAEQTPYWETSRADVDEFDQLFTTKRVVFDAEGAGVVKVLCPDNDGNFGTAFADGVVIAGARRTHKVDGMFTGKGAGLRIEVVSGFPRVRRVRMWGEPREREIAVS